MYSLLTSNPDLVLIFLSFTLLSLFYLLDRSLLQRAFSRNWSEWWVDLTGLLMQGLLVPVLQVTLIFKIWQFLLPGLQHSVSLNGIESLLIHFFLIDYLYYWNHRALHSEGLWRFHLLHHSARSLDPWVTSRNSFITPLFIVYIWTQSFFVFVLNDPKAFLIAAALSSSLDLWRHSSLHLPSQLERLLGTILILPRDHEWHHSKSKFGVNYGANLNIWDRMHGSFYRPEKGEDLQSPPELGVDLNGSIFRKWIWP